jgi:hypothetical protein
MFMVRECSRDLPTINTQIDRYLVVFYADQRVALCGEYARPFFRPVAVCYLSLRHYVRLSPGQQLNRLLHFRKYQYKSYVQKVVEEARVS